MSKTTIEALNWAFLYLKPYEKMGIDDSGAKLLLANMMHWDNTQLVLHYRQTLSPQIWQQFQVNVKRYAKGEPVQYITGQATFYGSQLFVDRRVLIPRFETEELVEWVLKDNDQMVRDVLDLGTGSGAIAIALKKQRQAWQITGSDISQAALEVAKLNVNQQKVDIHLEQSDLFENIGDKRFDVIVCNPPYIAESEKNVMDQSVLTYEPNQALFAKNDGLAIYEKLSQKAEKYLKVGGRLYCEFGYHQKADLSQLFGQKYQVVFKKDVTDHDRMMRAIVNSEGKS